MNTSKESIEQQIISLLVSYLAPRWEEDPRLRTEIKGTTNLTSDLTLDSFQVMEFLMEIEDALDLAIDMNSLSDVHTISDLAAVVAARVNA